MPRTVTGLDPHTKAQILARLRSIEGHWRAVVRMVDEDRYCVDVIKQIHAVQSAVDKAAALLLERHLNHCVTSAIRSDNPRQRERAIAELLDVFEHRARPTGGRRMAAGGPASDVTGGRRMAAGGPASDGNGDRTASSPGPR